MGTMPQADQLSSLPHSSTTRGRSHTSVEAKLPARSEEEHTTVRTFQAKKKNSRKALLVVNV
jgi:hypothetical protein